MSNAKQLDWVAIRKRDARTLLVLTLMYFCIELIVNFSVYKQLSVTNDVFTAEAMELWGKVISGVGIGLLVTRYLLTHREVLRHINIALDKVWYRLWDKHYAYRTFINVCVITIPLSFFLQNTLISYVVSHSSVEGRNKALIITATHSALTPFYSTGHWGLNKEIELTTSDRFFVPLLPSISSEHESYKIGGKHFVAISQDSVRIAEDRLGVHDGLGKVFFPYKSLINDIDENLFKEIIEDNHLALYRDQTYFRHQTKGGLDQSKLVYDLYNQSYSPASTRYDGYKTYKNNISEAKREADKQWRVRMDESFGFKTKLKPNLSFDEFAQQNDVKKLYAQKTELGDLYPYNDDFNDRVIKIVEKEMPAAIIPAYINVEGEPSIKSMELTDDEIEQQGKKAYKAIVMPIIALGLSAFFLILNIIIFINDWLTKRYLERLWLAFYRVFITNKWWRFTAYLKTRLASFKLFGKTRSISYDTREKLRLRLERGVYYSTKFVITKGFIVIAMLWFVAYPFFQSGEGYDDLENSRYKNTIKWVYYHEGNLIAAYDLLTDSYNTYNEKITESKNASDYGETVEAVEVVEVVEADTND